MNDKLVKELAEEQISQEFLEKLNKTSEESVKNSIYARVAQMSHSQDLASRD